ncbi:hypothetical protein [Cryobacterium zongtaii]|uniref:hypothetical protein n=1 Tax=Cryobacterium zongtaii TaxID=1259217 RepID=UPI0013FE348D|nr:hypothetical protein [Cryobacterium zongtaii]
MSALELELLDEELVVESVVVVAQPARAMPLANTMAIIQVALFRKGCPTAVVVVSSIFLMTITLWTLAMRRLCRSYEKPKRECWRESPPAAGDLAGPEEAD